MCKNPDTRKDRYKELWHNILRAKFSDEEDINTLIVGLTSQVDKLDQADEKEV